MVKIILALVTLVYPFVVFYGLAEFSIRWVSFILLLLFSIRLLILRKSSSIKNNSAQVLGPKASKVISVLVLSFLLCSFIFDIEVGLLFYPVIINSALALIFSYSLVNPPPVIERLARLTQADLPAHAVIYTRTVTKVWLGFFILNGLVACYTALFTSLQTWTIYNGFIAYILMAILFCGEYLVRLRVQKLNDH